MVLLTSTEECSSLPFPASLTFDVAECAFENVSAKPIRHRYNARFVRMLKLAVISGSSVEMPTLAL